MCVCRSWHAAGAAIFNLALASAVDSLRQALPREKSMTATTMTLPTPAAGGAGGGGGAAAASTSADSDGTAATVAASGGEGAEQDATAAAAGAAATVGVAGTTSAAGGGGGAAVVFAHCEEGLGEGPVSMDEYATLHHATLSPSHNHACPTAYSQVVRVCVRVRCVCAFACVSLCSCECYLLHRAELRVDRAYPDGCVFPLVPAVAIAE